MTAVKGAVKTGPRRFEWHVAELIRQDISPGSDHAVICIRLAGFGVLAAK